MVRFRITVGRIQKVRAEALLLWAHANGKGAPALRGIDGKSGEAREIAASLRTTGFKGKAGSVALVWPRKVGRAVLVCGLGPEEKSGVEEIRRASGAGLVKAREAGLRTIAVSLPGILGTPSESYAVAEGMSIAAYKFTFYKSPDRDEKPKDLEVSLVTPDRGAARDAESGARKGETLASGVNVAREWANRGASDKTPVKIAEFAKTLALGPVTCTVFDEKECRRRKMNAYLSVAAGSDEPPRFIHLRYRPKEKAVRRIAVVGKGVTFDSGGLSLKQPKDMEDMKYDMSGAAAVLGLFSILPRLSPPVEIHGIIAATENMPSGHATRPGDVVRAMTGKSIEILNTDAEGRLTLADAVAYAAEQGVDEIIDLATLTGACMVALGSATGVFGRPQEMVDRVLEAARAAGDRSWPMPLFEDYREWIKSEAADIKNAAGVRWGGAITAALFIEEFVPPRTGWVHMDIAGSAWAERDAAHLRAYGATGTGVRTLVHYIQMTAGSGR